MAVLDEVQRKWVNDFLGKTGAGAVGATTGGLKAAAPRATPTNQGDSSNGSPAAPSLDAVTWKYGQVSADSSMPDEPQGKVSPILVEMTPPPGVTLPTLQSSIVLVSPDGKRQEQPRGQITRRPEYVDNFTKATLKVPIAWEMKDANKLTLNLFYSSGNPFPMRWPWLLFQWEQPAYTYNWQIGKIIPVAHDGNPLFDKNNTPSIITAALFFKDELDKLAAKYEEIADITYTIGGAIASSAGHLQPRIGSFSGGRYGRKSGSGSKGGGTAGKPTTGSGTGRTTGATQNQTTGGAPKGGPAAPAKPTGGDGNITTPMRLPESKGPARGGGATGKPGSGGSGEKGRTPVKAANAKGKGDDGDRGRTAGKRGNPNKKDKTTGGEGKTANKGSGSGEPTDKGGGDPAKPKPTGKKRAPNESTSDTGGKGGARQPPPPRGTLKGDVKKLEPAEQDFVENRLSSGKNVEIIPTAERRTPDFKINGVQHELKTISGVTNATSDGISKQMASRIMDGRGQAEHVIVDMRKQPGINYDIAKRGIGRAFGADNTLQAKAVKAGVYHNQIQSITVVGPGWEITVPRTR